MRTVIVSDLHLGAGHGADLVRREAFRDRLFAALGGADQIVLLGDVVELRDSPVGEALDAAAPFFRSLGEVAAGARIVIVPGNHDHQLIAAWVEQRRLRRRGGPRGLELEQLVKAVSGPFGFLARAARDAGAGEVVLAYPGLWVEEGVYATHGHYLDAHLTVPTFERLGVAAIQRVLDASIPDPASPEDYERVQAPLYAFLYALAQAGGSAEKVAANPSARVWAAVSGAGGPAARVRGLLLGSVALPGAVRLARTLGLGRFSADLSLDEVGRAGVRAMSQVAARLRIESRHIVFGHTHRAGPAPRDSSWSASNGARLVNTGSWVWSPALVGESPAESPFWPGTVAVIEAQGEPELRNLLDDLDRGAIAALLDRERDDSERA